MNHSDFQENLAAYALGALDAEEIPALEEHLQGCESCRTELVDYQQVSTGLLTALPPRAPRSAVRRQLQQSLGRQSRQTRPQFSWSWGQLAVGVLLAALLAMNVLTISQVYSLRREQAELIDRRTSEQTAIAMLAYPTTKSVTFEENGVSGSLLVDKQRNLVAVFAWNMSMAPSGKTYQMWLIDPKGDRTSGGFLVPETGYPFVMAVVHSPQPLSDYTGFGVTVEPAAGSPKPTGQRVLRVDF